MDTQPAVTALCRFKGHRHVQELVPPGRRSREKAEWEDEPPPTTLGPHPHPRHLAPPPQGPAGGPGFGSLLPRRKETLAGVSKVYVVLVR